ncbi:hypothetical protein GQ607_001276 [Colletotrichum asianum]|uniref:Uncharacterized protein n=1 Tax=Colletotrichum asianum TaxID=702518 RepID=A0A8H3WSB2_9PEZI|nr:hypothetical protein GQ607_001276 [Colletotrichum asianum]
MGGPSTCGDTGPEDFGTEKVQVDKPGWVEMDPPRRLFIHNDDKCPQNAKAREEDEEDAAAAAADNDDDDIDIDIDME